MARRRRVEHPPAAERAAGPQDHPITARGDRRARQPQLRESLSDGAPDGRGSPRAVMDLHARTVGERLELGRARRPAGTRPGYAPPSTRASPRPTCDRSTPGRLTATRRPASARSTGSSCTSTLRTRTSKPAGSTRSVSPAPTEPDQSVPVTTVPMPASVNERSMKSRVGPGRGGRLSGDGGQRLTELLQPRARAGADGQDGDSGHELASLLERERELGRSSTASAFVTATTPRSTPSRRRMARCSCVCGRAPSPASMTSRKRSMPVAPATIVRTNRSCPGTSTSESDGAADLERREAELDRDASPLLLRAAGPCPFRSGPARARSCRGRRGRRCRLSARTRCVAPPPGSLTRAVAEPRRPPRRRPRR